ncbi:hypothetical protein FB451DRAFT_1416638 [Mycena latifolia]|nr:hypothetical protein FB451DRAFT_1416638 [Mycena latifolia]
MEVERRMAEVYPNGESVPTVTAFVGRPRVRRQVAVGRKAGAARVLRPALRRSAQRCPHDLAAQLDSLPPHPAPPPMHMLPPPPQMYHSSIMLHPHRSSLAAIARAAVTHDTFSAGASIACSSAPPQPQITRSQVQPHPPPQSHSQPQQHPHAHPHPHHLQAQAPPPPQAHPLHQPQHQPQHQILEHCMVLYSFANRYAQLQASLAHVQPTSDEVVEMANHANEVVRLLQELRCMNSEGHGGGGAAHDAGVSAGHGHLRQLDAPAVEMEVDMRVLKQPWEEMEMDGDEGEAEVDELEDRELVEAGTLPPAHNEVEAQPPKGAHKLPTALRVVHDEGDVSEDGIGLAAHCRLVFLACTLVAWLHIVCGVSRDASNRALKVLGLIITMVAASGTNHKIPEDVHTAVKQLSIEPDIK